MDWQTLNSRRVDLGISMATLARLSHVSLPTVQRILSGRAPHASFANVLAIAATLGVHIGMEMVPRAAWRRQRALEKARKLVGMVQATSALEGQAVGTSTLDKMIAKTATELLKANGRSLWEE